MVTQHPYLELALHYLAVVWLCFSNIQSPYKTIPTWLHDAQQFGLGDNVGGLDIKKAESYYFDPWHIAAEKKKGAALVCQKVRVRQKISRTLGLWT